MTGASKGIGAGVAKRLAADGATVVVNFSSSRDGAEAVVAEIKQMGGHAIALDGSVADEAQVSQCLKRCGRPSGRWMSW